jgi:hypothetical protein
MTTLQLPKRKLPGPDKQTLPDSDNQIVTKEYLLSVLGPAPTVAMVSQLFGETPSTTWRRLNVGELRVLPGTGTTRVSIESLIEYLNASVPYEITHSGRGRKKKGAEA